MTTVLITGRSGVIERAILPKLIDKGAHIRVYDIKPPLLYQNIEFIYNII